MRLMRYDVGIDFTIEQKARPYTDQRCKGRWWDKQNLVQSCSTAQSMHWTTPQARRRVGTQPYMLETVGEAHRYSQIQCF